MSVATRDIEDLIVNVESALRVRARDRVLAPVRLAYQKRLRAAFLRQGKAFLDRAIKESNVTILWRDNDWQYRLQEAIGLDWERDWELAVHILDGDKREATDEALRNSILHGAAHINKLVAKDKTVLARADYTVPDFDLKSPRAVEYLRAHGADMIQGVDDTAKERMRSIISDALEQGASSQSIAKDIRAFFSDMAEQRSELIARTETGNAYEFGSNEYAQQLADANLNMEKSWSTVGDDKVDEECAANEDVGWIPIGDTFPSGDDTPLAHPNCRCTCLYRVAAAAVAEARLREYSPDQPRDDHGRFAPGGGSEPAGTGRVAAKIADIQDFKVYGDTREDYANDKRGDGFLARVCDQQGFSGKPGIITQAEFDQRVAAGEQAMYRGDQLPEFADQLKDGDYYLGNGVYGNGTYVAYGAGAENVAIGYAGPKGVVSAMLLKSDANVISSGDLKAEMSADEARADAESTAAYKVVVEPLVAGYAAGKTNEEMAPTVKAVKAKTDDIDFDNNALREFRRDDGIYAASHGYDAINVGGGYMVVVNRTALDIVDTSTSSAEIWKPGT